MAKGNKLTKPKITLYKAINCESFLMWSLIILPFGQCDQTDLAQNDPLLRNLQLTSHDEITDHVNIRLMRSNWPRLTKWSLSIKYFLWICRRFRLMWSTLSSTLYRYVVDHYLVKVSNLTVHQSDCLVFKRLSVRQKYSIVLYLC